MKKILVTGATGLLGTKVMPQLLCCGHIFTMGRSVCETNLSIAHEFIDVDLAKEWTAVSLPGQMDTIIHLAQSAHFREFPAQAMDIFNVNVATTQKLLDYAVKVGARQFILASSGGVYGYGDQAFNENATIQTRGDLGYYLGTKLCMEVLAENYSDYIDIIILRFFFVYGPGQKRTMLIPRLVDSVRNGYPIKLQGQDGIRINPMHVNAASTALVSCMDLEGSHKINVAGPETLSLRKIGATIGEAIGKKPVYDMDQIANVAHHLIGDIKKMSTLLTVPRIWFRDGIRSLIE